MTLVLSLFPGGGLLDAAFELEGFTVVKGPDPLWGGDIREFDPPAGHFEGIIGGDPCQAHSRMSHLVRAKGLEPAFPDLTPEYRRIVERARPIWFLRENVPDAPDLQPEAYDVHSFLLDHSTLDRGDGTGHEQRRRRRFWFGVDQDPYEYRWRRISDDFVYCRLHDREAAGCDCVELLEKAPDLRAYMDFALFELPDVKKVPAVTGAHSANGDAEVGLQPRRSIEEMLRLQGLPANWLEHQPWTMEAKRKIIGNGVPIPMGRQLARAIGRAMGDA